MTSECDKKRFRHAHEMQPYHRRIITRALVSRIFEDIDHALAECGLLMG